MNHHVGRVMFAIRHHARALEPLAMELFAAVTLGKLGTWESTLGGPNSNYIERPNGKRFYLRGIVKPMPRIEVRTSRRGPVVAVLKSRNDVWRWAEKAAA